MAVGVVVSGEAFAEGDELEAGVGVDVSVGAGVIVGVGSGKTCKSEVGIASGLGSFKKGTKLMVPKLKSYLESYIVWFIAETSVVPHQL